MDGNSDIEERNSRRWDNAVEARRLLVILEEQQLSGEECEPEEDQAVDVHHWHAGAEHQADNRSGREAGNCHVTLELGPRVQLLQLILCLRLGVRLVIVRVFLIFLDADAKVSIVQPVKHTSKEDLNLIDVGEYRRE